MDHYSTTVSLTAHHWHPVMVHLNVGILVLAAIMLITAAYSQQKSYHPQLLQMGLFNLWLGAGLMIVTIITGWTAYFALPLEGEALAAMYHHRDFALYTSVAFLLALVMQLLWYSETPMVRVPTAMVLGCALALLVYTVYRGTLLVYVHGAAVGGIAAPQSHTEHGGHEMH